MDDGNGDDEFGLPSASIESEDHSDVDPFEELGIGSQSHIASRKEEGVQGYDALADLMDDVEDEIAAVESESSDLDVSNDENMGEVESTYMMLLQTVWVDGILDPAEVRLLAKKRDELGISFERHLQLVDDLLG
tara:strand:- start:406 stop:807 length:402 start_codon:yes stop_codon:yes gene_type:complete